jgi:hypothetical protein
MSLRRALAVLVCTVVGVVPSLVDDAVAAPARPLVIGVSRTLVAAHGGARIIVTGTGFTSVRSVRFGQTLGTAVRVAGPRRLSVTVPKRAAGVADVVVVTAHGTSARRAADHIRFVGIPTVSSVNPATGTTPGGSTVTVRGSQFYGTVSVSFGRSAGTHVHVVDAGTLTVRAPAQGVRTVDVRVRTVGGASATGTRDRYRYLLPPVTAAAVADTTATSVLLTWAPSAGNETVIRRDGTLLATVGPQAFEYRDVGLATGSDHTYTLTATVDGTESAPVTLAAATAGTNRPSAPVLLGMPGDVAGSQPGPCAAVSRAQGASLQRTLGVSATLANPDDPAAPVRADFELIDDSADPPTVLVSSADPAGQSDFVTVGSGSAAVGHTLDRDQLVDGHVYQLDAVADDGAGDVSAPSASCSFVYDTEVPRIDSISGPSTGRVGRQMTVVVGAEDPLLVDGVASGLWHFGYSLSSESDLDDDGGLHINGSGNPKYRNATIRFTPTEWGMNHLYVHVLDQAGNTSAIASFDFYVQG